MLKPFGGDSPTTNESKDIWMSWFNESASDPSDIGTAGAPKSPGLDRIIMSMHSGQRPAVGFGDSLRQEAERSQREAAGQDKPAPVQTKILPSLHSVSIIGASAEAQTSTERKDQTSERFTSAGWRAPASERFASTTERSVVKHGVSLADTAPPAAVENEAQKPVADVPVAVNPAALNPVAETPAIVKPHSETPAIVKPQSETLAIAKPHSETHATVKAAGDPSPSKSASDLPTVKSVADVSRVKPTESVSEPEKNFVLPQAKSIADLAALKQPAPVANAKETSIRWEEQNNATEDFHEIASGNLTGSHGTLSPFGMAEAIRSADSKYSVELSRRGLYNKFSTSECNEHMSWGQESLSVALKSSDGYRWTIVCRADGSSAQRVLDPSGNEILRFSGNGRVVQSTDSIV